jgi:hypothetical protein
MCQAQVGYPTRISSGDLGEKANLEHDSRILFVEERGARKFVCKVTNVSVVRTASIIVVNFNVITRCYIPEDSLLHTHHHENLKSHITNA